MGRSLRPLSGPFPKRSEATGLSHKRSFPDTTRDRNLGMPTVRRRALASLPGRLTTVKMRCGNVAGVTFVGADLLGETPLPAPQAVAAPLRSSDGPRPAVRLVIGHLRGQRAGGDATPAERPAVAGVTQQGRGIGWVSRLAAGSARCNLSRTVNTPL